MAIVVTQGEVESDQNAYAAPILVENAASGVTFDSVRFDSQLADLLWQAYGVQELYNNDFSSFLNDEVIGYDIDRQLSQISGGWNASVNPDGTIDISNVGNFPGVDQFSTGQTMTGFYFINKSLLDADGDGNLNYTFVLLDEAGHFDHPNFSSPLTKTGVVGDNLNGNFAEAYTGDAFVYTSSGQAYALIPTDDHPQIPEPSAAGAVLGALALAAVMVYKKFKG